MEKDKNKLGDLVHNFSNIDSFERVYVGQDFYIGLTNDKILDKVILNTGDERQKGEIHGVINKLVTDISNRDYSDSLDTNNKLI